MDPHGAAPVRPPPITRPRLGPRIAVAGPMFALALTILIDGVYARGFWLSAPGVSTIIGLELLAIFGFPILFLTAASRPTEWTGHVMRVAIGGGCALGYCHIAFRIGGWTGVGGALGFGLVTYGPVIHNAVPDRALREIGLRWLVSWLVLGFVIGIPYTLSVRSDGTESVMAHPAIFAFYFAVLGGLELGGAYARILDWPSAGVVNSGGAAAPPTDRAGSGPARGSWSD